MRTEATDDLASLHAALADCVAREAFDEAARIRDASLARLEGWWVGQGEGGDAHGHLVRVYRAFGRYIGVSYSARDLAQLITGGVHLSSPGEGGASRTGYGIGDRGDGGLQPAPPTPAAAGATAGARAGIVGPSSGASVKGSPDGTGRNRKELPPLLAASAAANHGSDSANHPSQTPPARVATLGAPRRRLDPRRSSGRARHPVV